MFKRAIDDGMIAAIMGNASPELIHEMREYASKSKKGKVMVIPKDKDLANKYILKIARMLETRIKTDDRARTRRKKRSERLPNVPRVTVDGRVNDVLPQDSKRKNRREKFL